MRTFNEYTSEVHQEKDERSTACNGWQAELRLFQNFPEHVSEGIEHARQRAEKNLPEFVAGIQGSIALGCATALLAKNPCLFGESFAPVLASSQRTVGYLFGASAATDLACKIGVPLSEAFHHPEQVAATRRQFGDAIGGTIFDYSTSGLAMVAGASLYSPAAMAFARNNQPRQMAFATGGSEAARNLSVKHFGKHLDESSFSDLVAFSKGNGQPRLHTPNERTPASVQLSGRCLPEKDLPHEQYQIGDIRLIQKTDDINFDSSIFFANVNVGDTFWPGLVIDYPALRSYIRGLNPYHLETKRSTISAILEHQNGAEAILNTTTPTVHPRYEFRNGILFPRGIPQGVQRLPDRVIVSSDIYTMARLPMKEADSFPKDGSIWLKFIPDEVSRSTKGKSGECAGRICVNGAWEKLDLYHILSPSWRRFDTLQEAEQTSKTIRNFLEDYRSAFGLYAKRHGYKYTLLKM